MAMKTQKRVEEQCLVCETKAPQGKTFSRGLCNSCRQSAYRMIKSGQATEETLVQKHLILPAAKRGGGKKSAWTKIAEQKLQNKSRKRKSSHEHQQL